MTDVMVSTRELPWMKLGKLVDEPMTAEEAAKQGGLDFTVSLRDVRYNKTKNPDAEPDWADAPTRKMVVRDDTDEWYDIVSADYGVLQYAQAFDFLSAVSPRFVAAGSMKGGRQGFMVIQLPDLAELPMMALENDPHELYVVVRTSHDRTRGIEVCVMPLRGRCMNGLGVRSFTAGVQQRWSVNHIGDVAGKLHNAEELVQRTHAYAAEFVTTANRLYDRVIDTDDGQQILGRVLRDSARKDEVIGKIMDIWAARETCGFVGSGWGLFNAVSEYFQWDRRGGTAQSQFLGILEGQTRSALDRAATLILAH